jgi:metallophosphoesterase (TIGR00282 family)
MRLLYLGDVIGRTGRDAVARHLPDLRRELDLDCVVANGENAAGGFGITETIAKEMFAGGIDVITTGNHVWDQKELIGQIDRMPNLLRPATFPEGTPGKGHFLCTVRQGRKVLVVNLMGRVFMDAMDDPFQAAEKALRSYRLGPGGADAILVDMHAEATSEKMAMGHHLDGRVSLVVGSHSHIPTADAQILPGRTGYQTDAGMCGDYDSVIGMKKGPAVARLTRKLPGERLSPADGEGTLCGIFCETEDKTGFAIRVEPVRLGGRLLSHLPALKKAPQPA